VAWEVTFFSRRLESELLGLPSGFLGRLIRYAERMEEFGPDLGMPHTRAMGGGLFELRIVFLHQIVKKSQRTPARDLILARRRLKEVMGG
jgi:phage-related protein